MGKIILIDLLNDEVVWCEVFCDVEVFCDIDLDGKWYFVVVFFVGNCDVWIGIEGVLDDVDGYFINLVDVVWVCKQFEDDEFGL